MSETAPEPNLTEYLARAYDAHQKPVFDAALEREVAATFSRAVLQDRAKALQAVMARDYVSRVHYRFLRLVLSLPTLERFADHAAKYAAADEENNPPGAE